MVSTIGIESQKFIRPEGAKYIPSLQDVLFFDMEPVVKTTGYNIQSLQDSHIHVIPKTLTRYILS